MANDQTVFGLNNAEANRVYRICDSHGCTKDQCEGISRDIAAADIRKAEQKANSFWGKIKTAWQNAVLKWFTGILTVIGLAATVWLTGGLDKLTGG